MSGIFKKMGIGLEDDEQYARAFQKGVLLGQFGDAANLFDKASKRFTEKGNPMMAARAAANALLYRYLYTKDIQWVNPLLQTLQGLPEIEVIKSQTDMMPVGPLCAELDCRLVESAIAQAQNDEGRQHWHQVARDKFQAIMRYPLITYNFVPASDGHNEKADTRYFFHSGMNNYYEAMTKRYIDPSAASDDLSLAVQSFKRCNDQKWQQTVSTLLENWRVSRTCWLCHRDMQGYELHFSMYRADVTSYTLKILEKAKQDSSTISIERKQIAVCIPCGSMVMYKAQEEADKVRRELNARLDQAMLAIQSLNDHVNRLERQIMSHH